MAHDAKELELKADYTKLCEEVFLETNQALLRSGVLYVLGRGELLSQAALQPPSLKLPSWASNFSYIPTSRSSRKASSLFSVGGASGQDPKFETRNQPDDALILRGVEIGAFVAMGPDLPGTTKDFDDG